MAETTHTLKIKTVLDTAQVKAQLAGLNASSAGTGPGVDNSIKLDNAINKLIATLNGLPSKLNAAQNSPKADSKFLNNSTIRRIISVYGVHQIGGIANQLAETGGDQQTISQTKGLVNTVQYMAGGMAFGGAPGALVGGIIGLLNASIDSWIEKLKESEQALDNWNKYVEGFSSLRKNWNNTKENDQFSTRLKGLAISENLPSLKSLKDQLQKQKDEISANLDKMTKSAGDQYGLNLIKESEEKFARIASRLSQVTSLVEQIENKKEQEQKQQERESKRFKDAISDFASDEDFADAIKNGNVQNLQDQMTAAAQAALKATTLEDFQKNVANFKRYRDAVIDSYDSQNGFLNTFKAFNEAQRAGYEHLDFEGTTTIEDIVKDNLTRTNDYLSEIKRLVNDIKNKEVTDSTAKFG